MIGTLSGKRALSQRNLLTPLVVSVFIVLASFVSAQDLGDLVRSSGVKGGLVVSLGIDNAASVQSLRIGDAYVVQALLTQPDGLASLRRSLLGSGNYGHISVDLWHGGMLPYSNNLVNLLVVGEGTTVDGAEILRVLTPRGVAKIAKGKDWEVIQKPWPEGMDEWTHYFHGPDGNPTGKDRMVGPPTRLQWIGNPKWARHHDHMASMTSLVSANGRIFYILDDGPTESIQLPSRWQLWARDAFNGVVLWKRSIPDWNTRQYPLKSGPAHLLRRLVAVGDRVYVTLGIDAPVTALDAATGETVATYTESEFTKEIVVSSGALIAVTGTEPSKLPSWQRISTYVWENTRAANPGWGWNGEERQILCFDTASAKQTWAIGAPVAPCSLATNGDKIVFHNGSRLVCLDQSNGKVLWEGEENPVKLPVQTNTGPRIAIYNNVVLFVGNDRKVSGWSLTDGKKLWENPYNPSGHMSLRDLFVVDGLVWTGKIANSNDDGVFTGYDPVTGETKRKFPPDVKLHWFHHRCYPSKACGNYLITGRNGTEYIDLTTEKMKPNHWVRGGCIYGIMPCNGMTYASMDACGCQLEAKLSGFKALASWPLPEISAPSLSENARLEKGGAYDVALGPEAAASDWPVYRHDVARSGSTDSAVDNATRQVWATPIGGRLTPPVIVGGKAYVASIDAQTVYAIDAENGKIMGSYTAGGRIDSAPTYYRGLLLFGSVDGYVYALRASDLALVWRFRAAPIDQRMMAWGQVESAWPVHGSVLVYNGILYCTAGRNMFLDGGIRFLRLDPFSGKLLGEVNMDDRDPESGEDMQLVYLKKTPGNTMPVALSDILSCDGRHIWMRSQKFDMEGKRLEIATRPASEQPTEDMHLFCQIGYLDDSYFFRSYWTYGRSMTGGYGSWFQAGRYVPAGRILCFDTESVYGYGRKPEYMVNASVIEYQLFAADKTVTSEAIKHVNQANNAMSRRSRYKNAGSSDWKLRYFFPREDQTAAQFKWAVDQPAILARAMVIAGDNIYMAGPPDVLDERWAYRFPDNAEVQEKLRIQTEALHGKHGGQLWTVNKRNGDISARMELTTIPVFDGLAAAGGKLYMTTIDGALVCYGQGPGKALAAANKPVAVIWEQKEDPDYLLPSPVLVNDQFTNITLCDMYKSKLGYRMQGKGNKKVGVAVNRLQPPLTGKIVFSTHLKAVSNGQSLLRNGYLAFGAGPKDEDLIKCGARLRPQTANIIQGPLFTGKSTARKIDAPEAKGLSIQVTVDLDAQTVSYVANGVTIEAKLNKPLKSITYVGYAADNALVDFAPLVTTPVKQ